MTPAAHKAFVIAEGKLYHGIVEGGYGPLNLYERATWPMAHAWHSYQVVLGWHNHAR